MTMEKTPQAVTVNETIEVGPRPFAEVIQEAVRGVDETMFNIVESDVDVLRDASRHILAAGGKRIRPRLLLLSYAAAGGVNFSEALAPAAAVELMHTASVVHDDINDHGVLRRGRPSVNAIWGRTFALLTGDFLFTKVYELMAPYQHLNVLLAQAAVALVEGETLQASAVKENKLNRAVYTDIIDRKTAALFSIAARIGAELAGATAKQVEALATYGRSVGLAFQIVDDILDLTADSDKLGKSAGIDVEQGKGLAMAYQPGNGHGSAAVADPMAAVKQKLLQGDAVQEGREQAAALVQAAVNALDALPPSEARDALTDLAHMVIDREA